MNNNCLKNTSEKRKKIWEESRNKWQRRRIQFSYNILHIFQMFKYKNFWMVHVLKIAFFSWFRVFTLFALFVLFLSFFFCSTAQEFEYPVSDACCQHNTREIDLLKETIKYFFLFSFSILKWWVIDVLVRSLCVYNPLVQDKHCAKQIYRPVEAGEKRVKKQRQRKTRRKRNRNCSCRIK